MIFGGAQLAASQGGGGVGMRGGGVGRCALGAGRVGAWERGTGSRAAGFCSTGLPVDGGDGVWAAAPERLSRIAVPAMATILRGMR